MREQTGARRSTPSRRRVATAVVAVGVGDGVQRLLASLGVQQVVAGGQSMNPSTAQILEAVERVRRPTVVIVLPNNKNIVPVARAGRRRSPTGRSRWCRRTSVVEALAALVAYDPRRAARRERRGDDATPPSGCAPARSRRRCATAWPSAAPISAGRLDRDHAATASASSAESAAEAAIGAASTSSSTTTASS